MKKVRLIFCLCLIIFFPSLASSQSTIYRGSIPEEFFCPKRGEAPRYPIDIVIGELGRGSASLGSFTFANSIINGFLSGKTEHIALSSIDSDLRENYLSALDVIDPVSVRIGGGRDEIDGAVSFLVRFLGKDSAITGELYVRYVTKQVPVDQPQSNDNESAVVVETAAEPEKSQDATDSEEAEVIQKPVRTVSVGSWVFEELLLDEAMDREIQAREILNRIDLNSYERFY